MVEIMVAWSVHIIVVLDFDLILPYEVHTSHLNVSFAHVEQVKPVILNATLVI